MIITKDGITIAALNVNVKDLYFAGSAQKNDQAVKPVATAAIIENDIPNFEGDPFINERQGSF